MARTLQSELRTSKPFGSLEQEAMLSLARTAAQLDHDMLDALKPYGLTPTQYNALRILRGAGSAGLCRNEVRDRRWHGCRMPRGSSTGWRIPGWWFEAGRGRTGASSVPVSPGRVSTCSLVWTPSSPSCTTSSWDTSVATS